MELWTSAATHALLPLLATDAGLRLQLATGMAAHLRRFGDWEGGFWLPECAYEPGLERELADHGVRAFCVDQTAARSGFDHLSRWPPRPARWRCRSTGQTVELVWNDRDGYPVHAGYRDYHRRTVHDLRPWRQRAAGLTTTPARASWHETHARDFVERAAARLASAGRVCSAAHWTPSCSATGGTRGSSGCARCSRRRRARASSWSR